MSGSSTQDPAGGDTANDPTELSAPSSINSLSQMPSAPSSSQTSSEINYTHPAIHNNSHIDSLQVFIDDVNKALKGALGRGGNTYAKVTILFLRWEDDVFVKPGVNNGVQGEIDRLEKVLVDGYGFDSEIYLIPSHNSHLSLMRRIMEFQIAHDSIEELLLVYYGGHGAPNRYNQSIWPQGKGPIIEWFSIQPILEHAVSDVLILLDCCFAASAGHTSVNGSVEVLAACGRELNTIAISDWSFTSRLTEVLWKKRFQRFTITQLHSDLMSFRAVTGEKKLLRTPVHTIMSNREKASVKICALKKNTAMTGRESPDLRSDFTNLPIDSESSQVLLAVSIKGDFDRNAWRDWLLGMLPSEVSGLSLISPEGIWRSHSLLALFSMSIALWDMLPNRSAYTFLGFGTSSNLIWETMFWHEDPEPSSIIPSGRILAADKPTPPIGPGDSIEFDDRSQSRKLDRSTRFPASGGVQPSER